MGRLTRIALLCLGLTGLTLGLECNVGSVNLDSDGRIVDSRVEAKQCFGLCTRRSPVMPNGSKMHILACEDRDRTFEADEVCQEDLCNRVPGKENEIQAVRNSDDNELAVSGLQCYVGIQVGSMALAGAVGSCTPGGYTGSCASATTYLGPYQATLFFCTSHGICDALINPSPTDGNLACSGVNAHPDYNITACCCYDSNNCNTQNFTVPTPLPTIQPSTRIPQACYEGIYIAGQLLAGGSYVACQGDCASVTFKYMGQYNFTMYSCDPASLCPQLGITNNCLDLSNGTLAGCCCNSDACIDPTVSPPRYPNGTRTPVIECYVGVHIVNSTTKNAVDIGASMACDGMCGRLKTTTNGYGVEAFYCASYNLCYALNTVGSCANMTLAGMGVETCCCWDSPNCNTNNTDITPVPPTQIPRRDVIACFQGIHVNNFSIAESYTGCAGDCASLTVQSSLNGDPYNVTLYTCDPTSVCQGLGIINRCAQIPNTPISGCCCDSDVCINPYARRFPNGTTSLQCAVGLAVPSANYTNLYQLNCDGTCASVETIINGTLFAGFFCAPTSTCKALDLRNDCITFLGDLGSNHVTACCCDYMNNCNSERARIQPKPYTPATNRPPIACWAGLGINQNFFNNSGRYMACQGACGLMTFRTSINGQDTNVTMYSCDPVDICPGLGLQNSCGTSPTGVFTGCCCDWNDCIDVPNRKINPYPLPSSVNCFIGLAFDGSNGTTTIGGQMPCDGQCGTIVTDINNVHTYGYFCAPQAVCSAFDVWNECSRSWLDWGGDWVDVCCCNTNDNCNIQRQQPNVTIPTPAGPAKRRTPISCYSGLSFFFNGTNYSLSDDDKYMACFGDCSQITYQSFVNGTNFLATMFTCDPVYLCGALGMSNSCANITRSSTSSISGCCCNYNDCINKQNGTLNPMPHKDDLQCFVGLQLQSNPNDPRTRFLSGSTMPCAGECAAINTNFNGYNTWAFMCAPQKLCDIFDTERECGNYTLDGGNNLQTCCCGMYDNCNLRIHNIPVPSVSPSVLPTGITPLACYAGLGLNGKIVSPTDRYMSCNGACATITYTAQLNGNPFSATIFSCDPVSLCQGFNLVNNCTTIQDGTSTTTAISGCCCGFNDCIDKTTFMPKPPPSKDNLQCFVGLQLQSNPMNASTRFLTGASGGCNGECGSVNTHFNGYDMWAFLCAPPVLCNLFDPKRQCGAPLQMDSAGDYLEICCCGGTDNCNVYGHGFPVPTVLPTVDTTTNPLACYAGVALNRTVLTDDNRFMACQGDCASLTYSSRYNGNDFSATIFSCDPVALCGSFNLSNSCTNLQNGGANDTRIRACCCGWNDCIDRSSNSSFSPKPVPHWHKDDLSCFTGLTFLGSNGTTKYGGPLGCTGDCMSVETKFNGVITIGFFCASDSVCDAIDPTRGCSTRILDRAGDYLKSCCCGDTDNCNAARYGIDPGPPVNVSGVPVLGCLAGIKFNNDTSTANRYMACQGDCAALTFSSTLNSSPINLTMFMCDPVQMCAGLGMKNRCHRVLQGNDTSTTIRGCCCEWNDCIDPDLLQIRPYPLPTTVNCFTGLSFQSGNGTTTYGGTMSCDGQCGSLVTNVNNIKTYGYYCAPQALCSAFEIWNECTRRLVDSAGDAVDICCCNSGDNCNIQNQQPNATIPTVPAPVSPGSPLACYSGLTFLLGGTFYNMTSSDRYMACNGACAAISYTTSVSNGTAFAATVFTCDPVSLCSTLGMNNQCVNITGTAGNGISGCCCNWNDCINKQTGNSINGLSSTAIPIPTTTSSSAISFIIATIVAVFVSFF